jgi:hypothetical protein
LVTFATWARSCLICVVPVFEYVFLNWSFAYSVDL